MDMNVSVMVADLTTAPPDHATTDSNKLSHTIIFVPILLIQIIVTVLSNSVLLMMIGRSFRSCTSLNIFLLSISIFNLLTIVSQASFVVYNLLRDLSVFPHQLCHLMSIIKCSTAMGITLLHLFISHHRYKIAKKPLNWQNTRKQAWLLGVIIWAIACAIAIFECVLHKSNGNKRSWNLQMCLWPGLRKCTTALSLYIQILCLICLSCVSAITCYFYMKAAKELKDNEAEKEYRLRTSTLLKKNSGKRKWTSPERAVVSLFTIFIIHYITQLPTYIYSIIIHSIVLSRRNGTPNDDDLYTDGGPFTSSNTPIILLIVCISFLTNSSPLVLACINKRFKHHVKSIVHCICGSEEDERQTFLRQIIAQFPEETAPPAIVEPQAQAPPFRDFDIFYTAGNRSRFYIKSNNGVNHRADSSSSSSGPYQQKEQRHHHQLQVPTSECLRPDINRLSTGSLSPQSSTTPRPSRVSTNSVSVGVAAVNAGLVLSAPGHRIMINNFFVPDANEAMLEELATLNFI